MTKNDDINKDIEPKEIEANNIAVIAVHGVSDQQPFASAREVANLLINPNIESQEKSNYSFFKEKFIHFFVNHFLKIKSPSPDADHKFTEEQLSQYRKNSFYNTICLKGKASYTCKDPKGKKTKKEKEVHIYEMYWADLSRLSENFFRIFGELYQILFHLSKVGTKTADLAREFHNQNSSSIPKWILNLWGCSQHICSYLLSSLIPIFNLYLLIVAFVSIPVNLISQNTPDEYFDKVFVFLLILVGLFSAFILSKIFFREPKLRSPWLWGCQFLAGLIVSITMYYFKEYLFQKEYISSQLSQSLSEYLITFAWLSILISLFWFILIKRYDKQQPGIAKVFASTGIIIPILLIIWVFIVGLNTKYSALLENANELTTYISLNAIEIIYFSLFVFWIAFTIFYLLCLLSGLIVCLFGLIKHKYFSTNFLKLLRAYGISLASLVLPASLFIFITLTLWSVLNNLGSKFIYGIQDYDPMIFHGLERAIYGDNGILLDTCKVLEPDISSGSDCFLQLLSNFSASNQTNYAFIIFWVTLLIAIWALFPAIITDIFPPEKKSVEDDSEGLGHWLTNGYTALVWLFLILICIFIPVVGFINYFDSWNFFFSSAPPIKELEPSPFLSIPAWILTISAGTLIALGTTLKNVSLGLRGILDAALDVDNYLRIDPLNDNSRAKIYSRYVSLLKHLCDLQYDAIVIIAHSQGTVITADLLRFLKHHKSRLKDTLELENMPNIYLFTMGSPIRQLYSFAFPHLYHWVYDTSDTQDNHSNPDPSKLLNVKQWVNAYRSGDYIGRYLWRSSNDKSLWKKVNLDTNSEIFLLMMEHEKSSVLGQEGIPTTGMKQPQK